MPAARRPNVLVFFTDQQRADTLGANGSRLGLTPNLDRLAARGTHVPYAFTCQPVCGPARSCLLTGRYATQTGVWRNGFMLDPAQPTTAQLFGAAGYETGYIGKWHLGDHAHMGYVKPAERGGFRRWLAANVLEFTSDAYSTRLWDEQGRERSLPGYRVDALTDVAIRWVDEWSRGEVPWFLTVSYIEPHHQNHRDDYPAPDGYEERYASAPLPPDLLALGGSAPRHWPGYCGMIERLDEALGRLLDALKSTGQLENTVVLFVSDHGCHFKTRNGEYKRSCHDASIRIPCVLAGPGFDGGGRVRELVSLVDLPPTLLDAAGIRIPDTMAGRSLRPLVGGRGAAARSRWPEEVFVQISESQIGRAVRTARWKYAVRAPDVDGKHRGATVPSSEVYADDCLYDLLADPWELENLIGYESHRETVLALRRRLVRRMKAAGEAAPRFIDAPVRPAGQRHVAPAEARS